MFTFAQYIGEFAVEMSTGNLLTRENVQDYLALFPDIVLDILEDPKWKDLGGTRQWAARVLFRNVCMFDSRIENVNKARNIFSIIG